MHDRRVKRVLWWSNGILRLSSWIVPRKQRRDWLREWRAEVWHWVHFLDESGRLEYDGADEVLQNCWGSFADALWHRFNRERFLKLVCPSPIGPSFCIATLLLVWLVLLAAASNSWFQSIHNYFRHDLASRILTVSLNSDSYWVKPEILRDITNQWPAKSRLIAKAESYAWRPTVVRGPGGRENVVGARVTPGLFALLGGKPTIGRVFCAGDSTCPNCVVLSDTIWKDQFGSERDIVGRRLVVDGHEVTVIGVLSSSFRIPGLNIGLFTPFGNETDPWLLSFEEPGVVIRLVDAVKAQLAEKEIQAYINDAGSLPPHVIVDVLSTKDLQFRKWVGCAGLLGIGLLAFSFLAAPSLWRLRATGPRHKIRHYFRWWGFFALKSSLLVFITFVISADLVQVGVSPLGINAKDYADGIFVWLSCVGSTIALIWSIRDQFGRCRFCLRRLTKQMVLGTSAGVLSGPTGVEVICGGGHGSLHLPIIFHSCLDSRYWTEWDDSWQSLVGSESMASIS